LTRLQALRTLPVFSRPSHSCRERHTQLSQLSRYKVPYLDTANMDIPPVSQPQFTRAPGEQPSFRSCVPCPYKYFQVHNTPTSSFHSHVHSTCFLTHICVPPCLLSLSMRDTPHAHSLYSHTELLMRAAASLPGATGDKKRVVGFFDSGVLRRSASHCVHRRLWAAAHILGCR
jgi:hypothetical protein